MCCYRLRLISIIIIEKYQFWFSLNLFKKPIIVNVIMIKVNKFRFIFSISFCIVYGISRKPYRYNICLSKWKTLREKLPTRVVVHKIKKQRMILSLGRNRDEMSVQKSSYWEQTRNDGFTITLFKRFRLSPRRVAFSLPRRRITSIAIVGFTRLYTLNNALYLNPTFSYTNANTICVECIHTV